MKNILQSDTKIKSIKSQIRNLQLGTILLLIIVGCFFASLIFAYNLKEQKLIALNTTINIFYKELILQNESQISDRVSLISNAIEEHGVERVKVVLEEFSDSINAIEYTILDQDMNVILDSEPMYGLERVKTRLNSGISEDVWLDGSEKVGLEIYKLKNLPDQNYIVICKIKIDSDYYVKWVKDNFNVDASVFFFRTRVASSITSEGRSIVGTQLDNELGSQLLNMENTILGLNIVLGTPYITAYQSFGNENEPPIAIIAVGESLKTFYASIRNMILSVGGLGFVLIVITSLISAKLIEINIVNPLESVTKWLSHYGSRELHEDYKPPVHFSELDNLFGTMTNLLNHLDVVKKDVESIAYYDELTGLPNRFYLFSQNNKVENKSNGVLIYIDADDLKTVNDILGHKIGDRLILGIAKYLEMNLVPMGFKIYRVGGDEFVLWHDDSIDDSELATALEIVKSIGTKHLDIDHYGISTTLSIGVARDDGVVNNLENLMRNAEIAMYQVKKTTKNNYLYYDKTMSEEMILRQTLTEDIKTALEREELYLVYQPKLNLKTNRCDGFEALIRWEHPIKGFIAPSDFIPIAEETGSIIEIGNWVLEESCRMIKQFNIGKDQKYKISVNVSPIQLLKEDFVQNVIQTMIRIGVEPNLLELEITETVLIDSLNTAVEKLRQLLILGVGISIDDFGKGYSSLAYLKHLPISTLKVDKMFVDEIDPNSNNLIRDIIHLGHHMGLSIVAEGIEAQGQLEYLKGVSCDYIQGYYFAKPMKLQDVETFISKEINGQNL